jgi:hypothetical protein
MTDTYERVRLSLIALLNDQNHKVVALRGKWGTGKTYLWRSLSNSGLAGGKKPIYVSLFGVRTIKELKLRILQSIGLSDKTAFKRLVETGAGLGAGLIKRFTGYSAEDGVLLWVSSLVKNKLIVIDDLERKHSSLHTDEVMGFLSEYSDSHGAQFLVLLNLEKLEDELWNTLHEKVVDGEVVLDPSSSEAFDIAANGAVDGYIALARETCSKLKLTNIRVIRKVLRVLHKIAKIAGPANTAYDRWVPSTVLLVASHYRGTENAPSFEYITSFNTFEHAVREVNQENQEDSEKEWAQLLTELGIQVSDEYEAYIYEYLQSGLMDEKGIENILERYQREQDQGNIYAKRREFFLAYWWDPSLSETDLKLMAQEVSANVENLSPSEVSELVGVIDELGDTILSRQVLDRWVASIDSRPEFQTLRNTEFVHDFEQLHPEVQTALRTVIDNSHPPLTLVEAVLHISQESSWGNRQTKPIESATQAEYEAAIRSLKLADLRTFLYEHLKWHGQQLGNEYFPNGVSNFVSACRNICFSEPSSRLANMIKRTFETTRKKILLTE